MILFGEKWRDTVMMYGYAFDVRLVCKLCAHRVCIFILNQ